MIKSKILSKEKKINHGFFNSKGGKSSGIYKSLNCGPGSKDKISKIRENLKIVRNRINKKAKKIFLVNQLSLQETPMKKPRLNGLLMVKFILLTNGVIKILNILKQQFTIGKLVVLQLRNMIGMLVVIHMKLSILYKKL